MKPAFDEMIGAGNGVREHYSTYDGWLKAQPGDIMRSRRDEAEMIFRRVGITFAVYGAKDEDGSGTERLIPFDLIPRVIPKGEWVEMEAGLRQRVTALNRFLHDVYHDQEILKAGIVPAEQVLRNSQFRPEMMGVTCRATSIRTSPASTSCAPAWPTAAASTTCWRTTCACPAA
jgi:uncharacterized circularly permuted ATP-grasp superfamily protein